MWPFGKQERQILAPIDFQTLLKAEEAKFKEKKTFYEDPERPLEEDDRHSHINESFNRLDQYYKQYDES